MEKYIRPMTNYRKANKDDIPCYQCENYNIPWFSKRGRCGKYPAVGKNNTCDGAVKYQA